MTHRLKLRCACVTKRAANASGRAMPSLRATVATTSITWGCAGFAGHSGLEMFAGHSEVGKVCRAFRVGKVCRAFRGLQGLQGVRVCWFCSADSFLRWGCNTMMRCSEVVICDVGVELTLA